MKPIIIMNPYESILILIRYESRNKKLETELVVNDPGKYRDSIPMNTLNSIP